ncbi:MAG: hypothetical protein AAF919_07905 [Pseudomonadota bacterium]
MITGPWQLLTAALSVITLLGLMWLVRRAARARGLSAEVQRKLVHIGTGLYAMTLPWLFTDRWPVLVLIAFTLVVMAVLRLPALAKGGIGETLHGVERQSWGDILLALAVLVVFLLADGQAILYILPLAILTLADAAAALTGSRYGRVFFPVEDGHKTLEGSVAFFIVTLILSMVCLLLLSDVSRGGVILLSVIVAAFATQVEAESWRGFDNFFLPAGVAIFLDGHLQDGVGLLIAIAILFALVTWAFLRAARALGLTAHTARVYVIAIFLLISATALQNVVLPILVFVAHGLARRFNPSDADHPELDIVAALALVSFGWLGLGLAAGYNAVDFWGLTAACLCAGLGTLAAQRAPGLLRLAVPLAVAAGLFALWRGIVPLNAAVTGWSGDLTALAVGGLALSVAVPFLSPRAFSTQRAGRLALLSLAAPLAGFALAAARMEGWT